MKGPVPLCVHFRCLVGGCLPKLPERSCSCWLGGSLRYDVLLCIFAGLRQLDIEARHGRVGRVRRQGDIDAIVDLMMKQHDQRLPRLRVSYVSIVQKA